MSKEAVIEIVNCDVLPLRERGRSPLLEGVSWRMEEGEAWIVLGANGSGKDDFLSAVAGEARFVPRGEGFFKSQAEGSVEIVSLERAAALIEQENREDESAFKGGRDEGRTGRRFIFEALSSSVARRGFRESLAEAGERLESLSEVKLCGVESVLDRGLKFMSTGEVRRVLLCRALLSGARLLVLSDPFAGLDSHSRAILFNFVKTLALKQTGKSDLKAAAADENFSGTAATDSQEARIQTADESRTRSAADAAENTQARILLGAERYVEVPDSITHVLEFGRKKITFCGRRSDYERLLAKRAKERESYFDAEQADFLRKLSLAQEETSRLQSRLSDSPKSGSEKQVGNLNAEDAVGTDAVARGKEEIPLVQMRGVNVGWDGRLVLRDLSWTVLAGEHWLIRGPNGSGKTTLLELITGDNHQVFCNDVRLFGKKRGSGESIWDVKARLGIVSYRMHVEYRMLGGTDLESVVISGLRDSIGLYGRKSDAEMSAADKWLTLAGFAGRKQERFGALSYGEQRAILIIRAAVKCPRLLILDEPCHALDDSYRAKILSLLETIAETGTTTLLHVTHDPAETLACERHILELRPDGNPMYRIMTRGRE